MSLFARFCTRLALWACVMLASHPAFAQCTGPNVPTVPMSAVISQGGELQNDGRGAYVDGQQSLAVNLHNAASLVAGNGPINKNSRYVSFSLTNPNPVNDPVFASSLGVIRDPQGELHVLYRIDPAAPGVLPRIHSIQELPDDGAFYMSERTDLFVKINGVRHLLMFGGDTWPINTCSPSAGQIFGASGTTKLRIARLPGTNTFILQAPAGSIARLFDYSNTFAPFDKGLYGFSFSVTFSPKPSKK